MTLKEAKREAEAKAIRAALKRWKGNRARAAIDLGVDIVTLYKKIRAMGGVS